MRRDLAPRLLLLLLLTLLAAFAWLTHHPEAPLLRRAEGWPFVGPAASWMREHYRPRPQSPEPAARPQEEALAPDGADLAPQPAALPPSGARPSGDPVWVLPGAVLRRSPSPHGATIHQFSAIESVVRLERRGDWFRIDRRGTEGWVFLEGYNEGEGPPYGDAPVPPRPLAPGPPDSEKLGTARRYLGDRERVLAAGPYTLYTDSRDDVLIARLDALAAQLETVYAERYGQRPLGTPLAALVLYRSELPYRLLQRQLPPIADLHSTGHSARGVAAFYVGGQRPAEVGVTLVHELVHFLNLRALGPALPPWLDEGLADDLAASRVDPDGTLRPNLVGGERRQEGTTVRITGGVASLLELSRSMAELGPTLLPDLLALDWGSFVKSDRSRLHYGASAFWIRYLLQGEDGRHRDAFRRFLAAVAEGRPPAAEALRQSLGKDWDSLDRSFRAWVLAEAAKVEPLS